MDPLLWVFCLLGRKSLFFLHFFCGRKAAANARQSVEGIVWESSAFESFPPTPLITACLALRACFLGLSYPILTTAAVVSADCVLWLCELRLGEMVTKPSLLIQSYNTTRYLILVRKTVEVYSPMQSGCPKPILAFTFLIVAVHISVCVCPSGASKRSLSFVLLFCLIEAGKLKIISVCWFDEASEQFGL